MAKNNTQFDNLINKILKKNKDDKLSKKTLQTLLKNGKILSFENLLALPIKFLNPYTISIDLVICFGFES